MIAKLHGRRLLLAVQRTGAILSFLVHASAGAAVAAPAATLDQAAPDAAGSGASAGAPGLVDARQLGSRLYATGPALLWLADGPERARLALRLLGKAHEHGLDPSPYGPESLARRLEGMHAPVSLAALDRDISAAMLQYLADLRFGRVASSYRPGSSAASGFDPVEHLRQALAEGGLEEAVESSAPSISLYARVKAMLAHYRELARATPRWPALPPAGPDSPAPGDAYEGADLLCERLRLLGDFGPQAPSSCNGRYTPALAAALRRFQARHGLPADGVLGKATLSALAVPLVERVAQLELTLERLRWLPPLPRGRIVAVNVPTYRLWAFDTNDASPAPMLEMRVIVGTAARTPTPLFLGQLRYLEFNPYWNVPPSIQSNEIVPKLARDPAYLQRNDMELVGADGRVLQLAANEALARLRHGEARVRQRPGARNVLGELKFAMPNPMNIYLHSTSSKELFSRTRRDLSHGCIRVERPGELAQFVLADPRRWDAGAVAEAMRPGATRTVMLARPVPVVLFYATALVDRHGQALFAQDIYRQDAALMRALRMR